MDLNRKIPTLFLSHQNADPDAIGSLYFIKNRIGGDVALPDQPDNIGKRLLKYLGLDYKSDPKLSDYEQVVVLDTPDPEQLKPIEIDDAEDFIVIDHHTTNHWDDEIIYEERTSCVELVYDLIDPEKLSKKEAVGLMSGLITDTSHFKRADSHTFRTAADILEKSGISLEQVSNVIKVDRSFSEKICRFKGIKRSNYIEINGYLVANTKVGSFESSVSTLLLITGADISFTGSQRDEEFLISGRAREEMVEKGIDLGRTFKSMARSKNRVYGGGHKGAGVLKGDGKVEILLEECVKSVVSQIRKSGSSRPRN